MRFLLIGPRNGGTQTGVSAAFELLIANFGQTRPCRYSIVDMNLEASIGSTGQFRLAKAWHVFKQSVKVIRKALKSDRAYLVISSSRLGFLKDFIVIWACFLFRCPVSVHLHGGGYSNFFAGQPRFVKQIISATLNRTESIIVLGELLKRQFDFVSKPKIVVVANGVESPQGADALRREKNRPSHGKPWEFLFLSNLMHTKGYLAVAEAFSELVREDDINVRIHFCGSFIHSAIEGPVATAVEHQSRFLRLVGNPQFDGKIFYHGNADPGLKKQMFRKCHALLLPTKYPGEGQPLCILEAMSFGLPTIATSHAGIPEQIVDGDNGLLLETGTPSEIRDAVRRLIDKRKTSYSQMSRRALKCFDERFTQEKHLLRLRSVLGLPESGDDDFRRKKAA